MNLPIIYCPQFELSLKKYGIFIPLLNQRSKQVVHSLHKANIVLTPTLDIPLLTAQDLIFVHDKKMVSDLFNKKKSQAHLMATYELIDSLGNFNRYDPKQSQRPLSDLFISIRGQASATYYALKLALEKNWSYFLGGGMHHAHFKKGSGFCQIHDGIVALKKLQREKKIKRAWIVDLDAHKGDATAALAKNDPSILTLSIHMKNSWPTNQINRDPLTPWWIKSTVDIEVAEGEEKKYLKKLEAGLIKLEKYSTKIGPPDVVWVIDGADAFCQDILPSTAPLQLSQYQMLQRSSFVASFFADRKIPQAWVMGGGYGSKVYKTHTQSILFLSSLFS